MLTAAQALKLLAQARMRKFTGADRETFVEYTPEDSEVLIGEIEEDKIKIILDGEWLLVYRDDDDLALLFSGVVTVRSL